MRGSLVLDLDEVVERPMVLRLLGIEREIAPVSLEVYSTYVNEFTELTKDTSTKNTEELAVKWHGYLSQFIKPLDLEEVKRMTLAQVAMCFSAIVRRIQGESSASISTLSPEEAEEKKKT